MLFRLYISYKDNCWKEKIVIEDSDIQHLYDEMLLTHVYESHWNNNHSDCGPFPYHNGSSLFPIFEQFTSKISALNINQFRYLMRSKIDICSYIVSIKRLA